tara:strand:- start:518 stop:3346 length:2829 start_codon:yes stop_codon:yes gene_type:complete
MYITLNSATEANDANFSNFFSDTLTIQPQSYICLNGAGFQTHDTSYDLGQIATFQFRLSYQYVGVTTLYTFPAGEYNLQTFCDTWNNLVIDASPYYTFFLNPQDTAANPLYVQVQMYRKLPPGTNLDRDFFTEHYFTDKTQRMASLRGQDPAIFPTQLALTYSDASASDSADRVLYLNGNSLVGTNYDFVCSATAPANRVGTNPLMTWYREPATTQDRYSFEMNRLTNKAICWSMADGGKYGSFFLDVVQTNYDQATTYMNPINQANLNTQYLMKIDCPNTGIATLNMRKTDGTVHTFHPRNFNPGDVFCTSLVPGLRAAPQAGMYDMKVEHMQNTLRQIAWIPCDWDLNTTTDGTVDTNIKLQDQVAYQAHYPCTSTEYQLYKTGEYMMGVRLGNASNLNGNNGVIDTASRQLITNVTCAATTPVAERIMKTARSEFPGVPMTIMPNENAVFLQRYSRSGTNHKMNQCISLGDGNLNTGLESALPTAYTISFYLSDDTAYGGGSGTHVILGGNTGAPASADILKVIIGTVNVTIDDYNGGFAILAPLLDGVGAAFPGWAYDTHYCVTVANGGESNNIISIQIHLADGSYYAASGTTSGANGRLPNLSYIGAEYGPDVNPLNPNSRMNGLVWDFRMCQQNLGETLPVSYLQWQNIHNTIAEWSIITTNAGVDKSSSWYFNFDDRVDWNTPHQNAGNEIIFINRVYPNMRVAPIWQKTDNVNPPQINWFHMGNFTAMPQVTTTAGTTLEANDLGNAQNYIGNYGFGIVTDGANPINNSLVRDIPPGANPVIPSLELLPRRTDGAGVETFSAQYIVWDDHAEVLMPFATYDGNAVANGVDVREQVYNICVENLPQRTFNGRTNNISKSIYEILHNETHNTMRGDTELINFVPKHKIWIPLRNAGQLPINSLHIKIADAAMKEVEDLVGDSHIQIEIAQKDEIFS